MASRRLPNFGSRSESDRRRQWTIGAMVLLALSLAVGTISPSDGMWEVYIWAALAVAAFFAVKEAFPDVWNYSLWLAGIYAGSTLGVLFIFQYGTFTGPMYLLAGAILELGSLGVAFLLILQIKRSRDEYFLGSSLRDTPLPLGIWSLSVAVFWALSQASTMAWASWAQAGGVGSGLLGAYIVMELIIIFLAIYILWLPQEGFERGAKPDIASMFLVPTAERDTTITAKLHSVDCPTCRRAMSSQRRTCPACGRARTFDWCPRCERFLVPCPSCSRAAQYGKPACSSCGAALGRTIACQCGRASVLYEWRPS